MESLVSDIPAGDGKIVKLFLPCTFYPSIKTNNRQLTTSSCGTHTQILNPQKKTARPGRKQNPLFPAEANNNKPTEPAVSDAANFIVLQIRTQQGK
jgi:hypothetical protein